MSCHSRVGLSISRAFGKVVVALDGPVDSTTAHCLRHLISDLVEGQGNLHVEIDLRNASVDATGAELLTDTAHSSQIHGGVLVVVGEPRTLHHLLGVRPRPRA